MAFGDKLQAIRHAAGLTQEQMAEELQVSRQAVSRWESNRSFPEVEKILYIANRYGVSMAELFEEEVPTEQPCPEEVAVPKQGSLLLVVDNFIANLSPKNKKVGIFVLIGFVFVALLMGVLLKGGSGDMTTIIWIAAIIIFGVVEAVTAGLVSIWFVIGGVGGLIVSILGGQIWLQVVVFFLVSSAALFATRPLVRKFSTARATATNADRVLGAVGRVTETIDNTIPTGEVYVDGKHWSARSETGAIIKPETLVRITRMEGVRLFVEKKED